MMVSSLKEWDSPVLTTRVRTGSQDSDGGTETLLDFFERNLPRDPPSPPHWPLSAEC